MNTGNLLAVQQLRLCASTTGVGSIPGLGTKILHVVWCSKKKKAEGTFTNERTIDWVPTIYQALNALIFCSMIALIWAFPGGSVVKNLPVDTGDTGDWGSILGLGSSPGEGNGNPL